MKKLSLLIFYKDYQSFLEQLRERGVVHIQENKERSAEDAGLQNNLAKIRQINDMIMHLENRTPSEQPRNASVQGDELLAYLTERYHRIEQIAQQQGLLQKEYALYEPWGDFSRERIKGLKDAGWNINFFSVQDRKFESAWEETYNTIMVNELRGLYYFMTVTPTDTDIKIDAEPFIFPEKTTEVLLGEIDALTKECANIEQELNDIASDSVKKLTNLKLNIQESTDEQKIDDAIENLVDDKVIALEGWIPAGKEIEMTDFLHQTDVWFNFTDPTEEDNVPVELRNNWYTRLFEPITEMFALPKYNELDPTPFFAPFFMLFFGLCLGDGGYGLLIWFACFWFGRKADPSMKGLLKLGQILGLATVVIGILTGAFFGIALDSVTWDWLANVKGYFITENNFKIGGYNPMMIVAVVLGLVQIFFGMCVSAAKATKQNGLLYGLSTIGWVVGLISTAAVFGLPIVGIVLPAIVTYILYALMAISAIAIVFLNSPGKGIVTNVGSALWNTYNMATGLLGDTLSYIRLFALGLTGSILGGVFNTLAFDLTDGINPYVRFIAVLLILLIGHSINFGLCLIGAFVHPMRLTFVEFYKNANFEGGGMKYEPFKKRV